MKRITSSELTSFIHENEILYGRTGRPEVMLTPDDRIVKCFYPRKLISTSTFIPQARRFSSNARKLLEKGIPAPVVEDVIYCQEVPVHMIVYKRLEGEDLRHLCSQGEMEALSALPGFLAALHERGIYFRAIHLGNLLLQNDNTFAILDMSDMWTRPYSLWAFPRARNLVHLVNRKEDRLHFLNYGVNRFLTEYLDRCRLRPYQNWIIKQRFFVSLDRDLKDSLGQ